MPDISNKSRFSRTRMYFFIYFQGLTEGHILNKFRDFGNIVSLKLVNEQKNSKFSNKMYF